MTCEEHKEETTENEEIAIPEHFFCPITQQVMQDPVVSRYGQSYERYAIIDWLKSGRHSCPITRQPLTLQGLITHHKLRLEILEWQQKHNLDIVKPRDEEFFYAYLTLPENGDNECSGLSAAQSDAQQQAGSSQRRVGESEGTRPHQRTTRRRILRRRVQGARPTRSTTAQRENASRRSLVSAVA